MNDVFLIRKLVFSVNNEEIGWDQDVKKGGIAGLTRKQWQEGKI